MMFIKCNLYVLRHLFITASYLPVYLTVSPQPWCDVISRKGTLWASKGFLENECICNYPSELGSFLRHILRSVALMHWWICQATNNRRRICKQQWRLSSSCLRCCLFNRVLRWWCYYFFFCQPVNLHHSDKKPNRILLILFIKMTFLNFD